MPQTDAAERRKTPRIPRRLPVRFGTEARMYGGSAIDISEGGIRVESGESFPVNSIVQVFVQFPRHSVRLKARVAWSGGGRDGGSPLLGLSFTKPEPALARAYMEWQAEVKLAEKEVAGAPQAAAAARPAASPDQAAKPGTGGGAAAGGTPSGGRADALSGGRPETAVHSPKGPVRRRLETRRGNTYDILMEPADDGWRLMIVQVPRQIGVGAADLEACYRDFAEADKALKDFIRDH